MSIAAVLMGLMFAHKHMEASRGSLGVMSNVREKADPLLRKTQDRVNAVASKFTWKEILVHAHNLFVFIGRLFMHISYRINRLSAKLVEKASRRKEDLSKRSAASFYMKQVSDAKENAEKGEIKDE